MLFIRDLSSFLFLAFITINFPLSTTFAASQKLYVVCSFPLSQAFLISLLVSSLIHRYFKCVVQFPHICEFSSFLTLLISTFIPLWFKKILTWLQPSYSGLTCFVTSQVIDPEECSVCSWTECILYCYWVESSGYVCQIFSVTQAHCCGFSLVDLFTTDNGYWSLLL